MMAVWIAALGTLPLGIVCIKRAPPPPSQRKTCASVIPPAVRPFLSSSTPLLDHLELLKGTPGLEKLVA